MKNSLIENKCQEKTGNRESLKEEALSCENVKSKT